MSSLRTVRSSPDEGLSSELLLKLHGLMVKARVLEERLIQMYKQGHGYFWIGGPGEEAFNAATGASSDIQGPMKSPAAAPSAKACTPPHCA